MKIFIASILFLVSLNALPTDYKKHIQIEVQLSPAGSFTIESKKIKGKVFLTESGNIISENIRIPVESLKTGVELRDNHLKKKLGIEQDKKAFLLLVKAKGKKSSGTATFKVLDKEQSVPFKFIKLSENYGQANFSLSLEKFGITGINYMGVGVKNIVNIKVVMPYKLKN